MTVRDTLVWAAIGSVALAYIAQRHMATTAKTLEKPPNAQTEVDPTRWRHDGTQSLAFRAGNKAPNADSFATEAYLSHVLAF